MANPNINQYLREIKTFLDEEIKTYQKINRSWHNLVFDINNKWIFRFAKTDGTVHRHELEKEATDKLAPHLPVDIPQFKIATDKIIINRKIPGVPLTKKIFTKMSPIEKELFITKITDFLATLHNFPSSKISNIPIKWPPSKKELLEEVLPTIKRNLTSQTYQNIKKYILKSFRNQNIINSEMTLVHGDLNPGNIIIQNNKLSGIIDFEGIRLSTPAFDFIRLKEIFNKKYFQKIIDCYKRPIDENFFDRIEFALVVENLYLIFWSEKSNRKIEVKIIKKLEKRFS